MKLVSKQDINFALANSLETIEGGTAAGAGLINIADSNMAFFITAVDGAHQANIVDLQNQDSVSIKKFYIDKEFYTPIRVDGGFKITCNDDVSITFCRIPIR